ncbi:MAG: hypothetical protein JWN25_330, partial [Verrucomicrobiales bacterium]|nr:hypothetical protein [Verrucomicrobiales bacterium]
HILPLYEGLRVSIAGRNLVYVTNMVNSPSSIPVPINLSTNKITELGSVEVAWPWDGHGPGIPALQVSVVVSDPPLWSQTLRKRQLWLMGLVLSAGVASLIGFFSARKAFIQQQRLNETQSNFVSSVSHELRAPIASVRLMAESLEREKITEPARQLEYFRFIVQECRRLSSLIENVLDFSRIDQKRKQYQFEPCDLGTLVEQTVHLMTPYARDKGVTLVCQLPAKSPPEPAEVDGQALQQALVNLLDNAIKHSPANSQVTTHLEYDLASSQKTPLAKIKVCDEGKGIPLSEQGRIFEKFYRLGSELRRETQGIGIGLGIVKHVVEAHAGRVIVESEPGKGSCFTLEFSLRPSGQTGVHSII